MSQRDVRVRVKKHRTVHAPRQEPKRQRRHLLPLCAVAVAEEQWVLLQLLLRAESERTWSSRAAVAVAGAWQETAVSQPGAVGAAASRGSLQGLRARSNRQGLRGCEEKMREEKWRLE